MTTSQPDPTGMRPQMHSTTHTHPAIDLTLAEGARGVGGQRTALVLLLQPRLHPPVSPPVSAPATAFPVFPQSFDLENSLRRGKFSRMQATRDSPLRTESKRRNSFVNHGHDH